MTAASIPQTVEQACYDVNDVARVLNVSTRHVWRLHDAGKLPAAVRLGKAVRWPRVLIEAWIADGCPARPLSHAW